VEEFLTAHFWVAVGQIIMIDILLGGDNAVVIALACRKLPPAQRRLGIMWGTAGAVLLRVVLIMFALTLLKLPYLKLVGALLLLWIGIKLLMSDDGDEHADIQSSDKLWAAVKTVIVADFVMSLDNVIAIAGAAEGAGGTLLPIRLNVPLCAPVVCRTIEPVPESMVPPSRLLKRTRLAKPLVPLPPVFASVPLLLNAPPKPAVSLTLPSDAKLKRPLLLNVLLSLISSSRPALV